MLHHYRITYTNGNKWTLSAISPHAARLLALAQIKLFSFHIEKIEPVEGAL